MMKNRISFTIVFVSSLLLSFLHCPLFEIFFDDKEIFKYTGLVIAKGGVPYRDFFDHKPPLIFLFNYLGLLFNGWGLWLIDSLLVLVASIAFFNLCKKYKLAFAWMPPVLFNLLIRDQFVSFGIGMTRAYTTIFILLFFCSLFSASKWKYYLLGFYAGFVFFMQQDQMLVLLPFFVYGLLWQPGNNKFRLQSLLKFSSAFALFALLILAYFAFHHSLEYFWQDAFAFNFNWYNKPSNSFFQLLANARNRLHGTSYEIPFYVTLILGVCSLVYGNKQQWLLIFSMVALLLSFCAIFISGKLLEGVNTIYYFLPLAGTICIVLFLVWGGDDASSSLSNKKITVALSVILLVQPLSGAAQYAIHLPRHRWNLATESKELQYLQTKSLNDYDLYIAFNSNEVYLYNELKIISPSKWIYHFFWHWFPEWDRDMSIIQSITRDLSRHHTKYVVDYSNNNFEFRNKTSHEFWLNYLEENYEQDAAFPGIENGATLWKLKSVKD